MFDLITWNQYANYLNILLIEQIIYTYPLCVCKFYFTLNKNASSQIVACFLLFSNCIYVIWNCFTILCLSRLFVVGWALQCNGGGLKLFCFTFTN